MQEELQGLFDKKFFFEPAEEWVLPPLETLYKESTWKNDTFISLKKQLNETKSLLNDKGQSWHQHTTDIDKAGLIATHIRRTLQPELLTNAWCKFYEILATFPLITTDTEKFQSLHICEAPGAFVSALNYYLCLNYPEINWSWFANTLNPYYEGHFSKNVVVDDRLLFHTLRNWIFGQENTGDIMSVSFLNELSEFLTLEGHVNLVTADGSFDCMTNPGEQELLVSDLKFSELLACLHILAPSGSFVIKNFTCFECITACTLYLLNCLFNKVNVFKPVTSKSGNSEVYIICLGFRGIRASYLDVLMKHRGNKDLSLFPKSSIPPSFMEQLEKCNKFFTDCQIASINENLELFDSMQHEKRQQINEIRDACVSKYFHEYSLRSLSPEKFQRLMHPKSFIRTAKGKEYGNKKLLYLRSIGGTFDNMEQRKNMSQVELLHDLEFRLNECFPPQQKRPAASVLTWTSVWKEIRTNVKRKSYDGWMTTGRTVQHIRNSKFGNPTILTLLNEIILDMEISHENHTISSHSHWNWEEFADLVGESHIVFTEQVLHVSPSIACDSVITKGVTSTLHPGVVVHNLSIDSLSCGQHLTSSKLIIIDPSCWGPPTFEQELKYKEEFVKVILCILKVLVERDSVVLHIQSLLTRFHVGVMFLFLSLFLEVAVLLPEVDAPAMCGQIWVLSGFLLPKHSKRVLEHLESALCTTNVENQMTLEVVPITAICSGHFYEHLLNLNNQFMLQRLRKLIAVEKRLTEAESQTNHTKLS